MVAQSLGKIYITCGKNLINKLRTLNNFKYKQRIADVGK